MHKKIPWFLSFLLLSWLYLQFYRIHLFSHTWLSRFKMSKVSNLESQQLTTPQIRPRLECVIPTGNNWDASLSLIFDGKSSITDGVSVRFHGNSEVAYILGHPVFSCLGLCWYIELCFFSVPLIFRHHTSSDRPSIPPPPLIAYTMSGGHSYILLTRRPKARKTDCGK